jgi:hypothetical protein
MDFGRLRAEARKMAETSPGTQISDLAGIVERLCVECAKLEDQVAKAERDAKAAKRIAKNP